MVHNIENIIEKNDRENVGILEVKLVYSVETSEKNVQINVFTDNVPLLEVCIPGIAVLV